MTTGVYKKTEEHKRKIGIAFKGKKLSEEHKYHISINSKGKNKGKSHQAWNKGLKLGTHDVSEETKQKIRETKVGNLNPMFGKHHSEEHRRKISEANKGRIVTEETRKKISKSCMENAKINKNYGMRGKHLTQEQLKSHLNGLYKRPTSFEKKISELCIENSLPFIYTGNGTFLINFKNPDFIDKKNKVVIEVFYSWFKIRDYGSVKNYKEFCREKYNSYGWKVIFIDENEVNINNWKEVCLNKIRMEGNNNGTK